MQIAFRKMGNSVGVIVPKAVLKQMGVEAGTRADLSVEGRIATITPIADPWEGWAEAAATIGTEPLTEEEQAWLDTPNDGDEELVC